MNYDCALETSLSFLRANCEFGDSAGFAVYQSSKPDGGRCVLAKLHGSVDAGPDGIVPPTWNKVRRQNILAAWQQAYAALSRANRIRIIGYSLPENDAHFRYLLKAAAANSTNLKTIDVLCLDDKQETVARRYRALVTEKKLDLRADSSFRYLNGLLGASEVNKADRARAR